MAIAAMPQTLDEISAPIPRRRLAWVRCERAFREIKLTPCRHRPAYVEWKTQVIDLDEASHRSEGTQISEDRIDIDPCDLGVEVIWHCRIHVLSGAIDTVVQCAIEVVRRPESNPSCGVWCNVRCQHVTKRRVQTATPGQ